MKKFSAKSIMSSVAFFLCAMTANALEITNVNGVMTMDYTKAGNDNLNDYNNNADLRKATTKLVIIGNHQDNPVFTNPDDWGIQTLDFSKAVLPSQYAFKKLYSLQEIIWPATGTFVIPAQAFACDTPKGALKNVTIPTNCTEVGPHAFTNSVLEDVTIVGPSTILRAESFRNIFTVKDVWVLSGEEMYIDKDGNEKCYCEKTAFSFDVTWVQSQIDRVDEAACLHIPENATRNVFIMPQSDVLTQAILCDTYHEKSTNGWQEFINNTGIIVNQKTVFRTFSDTKPHTFPACNNADDLKIYYVTGTEKVGDDIKIIIEQLNDGEPYTLPANTGALIYSKKGFYIYDMPETGESDEVKNQNRISQYTDKCTPEGEVNYLESLQDAPDNYYMSWSSKWNGKTYINMFLNNKRVTDDRPVEWGFYTVLSKVYTKDEIGYRAYLNFPTDILDGHSMFGFNDPGYSTPDTFDVESSKVFDLSLDDNDDVTGMFVVVKKDNTSNNSDRYYNIAGQQISAPGKGLYIHNGKKYMK